MALEILGSRLLAPVFGNSLFVWGALIGVVLAAMSSGYATGGWLADRRPPAIVLASLLLGAGIWTLLLAGFGQPIVFTVSNWTASPRWGPCLAASVMLAIPAFGLSGVLPALLRLAIADMGHLGRHTGAMIAISTIGSLAGTWGTSFYLLTWLGSLTLVAVLGIAQISLGMIWFVLSSRINRSALVLMVAVCGLFVWGAIHPVRIQPPGVYEEESPYQQVRVQDNDLFRFLILDNTFHAVMWKADPVYLALPYSQMMMATFGLAPHPKRALILGHGGGSLAKWLARHWPDLEVDVVEMDPSVVEAAARFFDYTPSQHHRVYVQDARRFLQGTSERYDVIWVDVFARHLIPFHLTTQEFFAELRSHLEPKGVIAVNLASSDAELDRTRAEAVVATMKTSFPHVESFSVKGPSWLPTKSGSANIIFFAGQDPITMRSPSFTAKAKQLTATGHLPSETLKLLSSSDVPRWTSGVILTDDFSPFDILQGSG